MRARIVITSACFIVVAAAFGVLPAVIATPNTRQAAPSVCAPVIFDALERVGSACSSLGRNQACYGSRAVNITRQPEAEPFVFSSQGDIGSLNWFESIRTSPYNAVNGTWGIAMIRAQVNLPRALPGQNATFLLFGDTELEPQSPDMQAFSVRTQIGAVLCESLPQSGLLIQTPSGRRARMMINGAEVVLGSTAHITATRDDIFSFALLEGHGEVSAFGVTRELTPGYEVRLALGGEDGLTVQDVPSEPVAYENLDAIEPLIGLLDRPFELPSQQDSENAMISGACVPSAEFGYTYVVQAGDTLSSIASSAGISVAELAAANCITNVRWLVAGQSLVVPINVTDVSNAVGAGMSGNENGNNPNGAGRPTRVCGDGICVPGENRNTCPADCPYNAPRDENGYTGQGNAGGNGKGNN
jgi:hypothetical protein